VKLEEAVARLTDSINLQTQYNRQMEQKVSSLQSVMSQSRSAQNQGYGVNNQSTFNRGSMPVSNTGYSGLPGRCFYCEQSGHRMPECSHVERHIELGWLKRVDGYLKLANGDKLPKDPSKPTKEVIEGLNKPTPGIIKLPPKTNLYSNSSDAISLLQTQAAGEGQEDDVQFVLELVQRMGLDKAKNLMAAQMQAIEAEEWEQNFE